LDTSTRLGRLPSGQSVLFVDTVGLISDLPHQLVDSFRATLRQAVNSQLLIHVRDVSHDETVQQKGGVLKVLDELDVSDQLKSSMIEVWNKVDKRSDLMNLLIPNHGKETSTTAAAAPVAIDWSIAASNPLVKSITGSSKERLDRVVPVSALTGDGISSLMSMIDRQLQQITGNASYTIEIDESTSDGRDILQAFYRSSHGECKVGEQDVNAENGRTLVKVSMTLPTLGRFLSRYGPALILKEYPKEAKKVIDEHTKPSNGRRPRNK
jgi:50S ribosomal subunit-associated GTPase HflX